MQRLSAITERTNLVDRSTTEAEGQLKLLVSQLEHARGQAQGAADEATLLTHVNDVLKEVEQNWRRSSEQTLADIISRGLSGVFDEEIKVTIESKVVRDTTSMTLKLEQRGVQIGNIIEGTGGSIVSVLNVLLLVWMLINVKPPLTRVLVLDEPFRMVESRHLPAIGQLLRELNERLGIQFIISSHEPELMDAADIVHEVQTDGTVKTIKTKQEEHA